MIAARMIRRLLAAIVNRCPDGGSGIDQSRSARSAGRDSCNGWSVDLTGRTLPLPPRR